MALLPPKSETSVEILERELMKVCMAIDAVWDETREDDVTDRIAEIKGEFSW